MSRYIDADELIVIGLDDPDCGHQFKFVPWEFIEDAPTADVVERKRGEWLFGRQIDGAYDVYGIKAGAILLRCSKCNFAHAFIDGHSSQYHFCPNCGAEMVKTES